MNSRKENKTFYQNNTVELNDEALAKVIGGGDSDCHQGWGDGNGWGNGNGYGGNGGNGGQGGYGGNGGQGGQGRRHCPGLLGDLLGDLLF
jgi:hypothetical protein